MTRTFESGPAIAPEGPLQDPPKTIEHRPRVIEPRPAEEPERIRLVVGEQQITVETLITLLHQAIEDDSRVAKFVVEADGCDCVGEAVGIRIDLKRGEVLVARKGWKK
jgi:hypothetical protein